MLFSLFLCIRFDDNIIDGKKQFEIVHHTDEFTLYLKL